MRSAATLFQTVPLLRPSPWSGLLALALVAHPPLFAADGGHWSLAALMPPGSAPVARGTPFWIELRNDSDGARLVCLQGALVALKSPDVAYASSHGFAGSRCTALTDFVVIRPGHALSRVVFVKARRGPLRGESEPLIELTFVERAVSAPAADSRRLSIRWVGTLAEAQRAGARLAASD